MFRNRLTKVTKQIESRIDFLLKSDLTDESNKNELSLQLEAIVSSVKDLQAVKKKVKKVLEKKKEEE